MEPLKKSVEVSMEITPEELGERFANSEHQDQIRALNAMAEAVKKWDKPWCLQVEVIVRPEIYSHPERLTPEARDFMAVLGDYARETM